METLNIRISAIAKPFSCVQVTTYTLTSCRRLNVQEIYNLRKAGFLGMGQGFRIMSRVDGQEEVSHYSAGIEPDLKQPYWEYLCEDTCDSSD